jgi:hypothetical protein
MTTLQEWSAWKHEYVTELVDKLQDQIRDAIYDANTIQYFTINDSRHERIMFVIRKLREAHMVCNSCNEPF